MNDAARGSDKGPAGARGWVRLVGAGSLRRNMRANAWAAGEVVVEAEVGPSVSGRPVAVSRSGSVSAGGEAPGSAADGVCASGCG